MKGLKRVIAIGCSCAMIMGVLSGCNRGDDLADDPSIRNALLGSQNENTENEGGVPGSLFGSGGSYTDSNGLQYDLDHPGDTQFDDVGLAKTEDEQTFYAIIDGYAYALDPATQQPTGEALDPITHAPVGEPTPEPTLPADDGPTYPSVEDIVPISDPELEPVSLDPELGNEPPPERVSIEVDEEDIAENKVEQEPAPSKQLPNTGIFLEDD